MRGCRQSGAHADTSDHFSGGGGGGGTRGFWRGEGGGERSAVAHVNANYAALPLQRQLRTQTHERPLNMGRRQRSTNCAAAYQFDVGVGAAWGQRDGPLGHFDSLAAVLVGPRQPRCRTHDPLIKADMWWGVGGGGRYAYGRL